MPFAFLFVYDLIFALLILILFPGKLVLFIHFCSVWQTQIEVYFNLGLGVITMLFWFISQFSDPGVIQKPKNVDFLVSKESLILYLSEINANG
jgi:hypothetical protein